MVDVTPSAFVNNSDMFAPEVLGHILAPVIEHMMYNKIEYAWSRKITSDDKKLVLTQCGLNPNTDQSESVL